MKRSTVKQKAPAKTNTKITAGQSQFSLFGGKATFTTEPVWFRLTVIFIIVAAMICFLWLLKENALPAIGTKILHTKATSIISGIKNRAP